MAESSQSYQPPVDQLLRLGDPRPVGQLEATEWRDYLALGLRRADIPELIRLVRDEDLHLSRSAGEAVWGPLHAWRALAQLGAVEAIGPLLQLANFLARRDDDWFLEEFPHVFSCIGVTAVEPLAVFLRDTQNGEYARIMAADSLSHIGQDHPESRESAVAHLRDQLARCADNDFTLNGFLVSYLIDLNGVEAADVIERAYAAGCVDGGVTGTWDDVRAELGVAGSGLVKESSPRNPNSIRDLRESMRRVANPAGYGEVLRNRRRDRRKRPRRRR